MAQWAVKQAKKTHKRAKVRLPPYHIGTDQGRGRGQGQGHQSQHQHQVQCQGQGQGGGPGRCQELGQGWCRGQANERVPW